MLKFLIITTFFFIAGNGLLKIFFEMIREGGALDVVFGWQKMLAKLYASENKVKQLLEKALGGCERCAAFWMMPAWFGCYCIVSKLAFHVWVTDWIGGSGFFHWAVIVLVNWIWYCMFHIVGATLGFFTLTKLFKKKANGLQV